MRPSTNENTACSDGGTADSSGNHRDGVIQGGVTINERGVSGPCAQFDGTGRIVVSAFRNFGWGNHFTASVWFQRTANDGNYQGIVSNGYGHHGSWEIRMGRENGGTMLGGGVSLVDTFALRNSSRKRSVTRSSRRATARCGTS